VGRCRYGALVSEDEVIFEGGGRDGLVWSLSVMGHDGFGKYTLNDPLGVYVHDERSAGASRDGQRIAVFEPNR
jgi:hypothetical protein